jgi:DNA-binding HxlR family transcriptional regulator
MAQSFLNDKNPATSCSPEACYISIDDSGRTHKKVSSKNGCNMKDHHGCPVQATINVLSGKWKVQILWHLSFGPRRFAQLRTKLRTISEKVLTDQLRQLETDGVILRVASNSVPPAVTYSLNPEGEKLVPMMELLCDWGCEHFEMKPNMPRRAVKTVRT